MSCIDLSSSNNSNAYISFDALFWSRIKRKERQCDILCVSRQTNFHCGVNNSGGDTHRETQYEASDYKLILKEMAEREQRKRGRRQRKTIYLSLSVYFSFEATERTNERTKKWCQVWKRLMYLGVLIPIHRVEFECVGSSNNVRKWFLFGVNVIFLCTRTHTLPLPE